MTTATIKLAAFDFKLSGLARSDRERSSRVGTGRFGRRRPVCPFSRARVFARSPALRQMNDIEIMSLRSASAIAIGLSARAVSRAQTEPSGPVGAERKGGWVEGYARRRQRLVGKYVQARLLTSAFALARRVVNRIHLEISLSS